MTQILEFSQSDDIKFGLDVQIPEVLDARNNGMN